MECKVSCFDRAMHLVKELPKDKHREAVGIVKEYGLQDLLEFCVEHGCCTILQSYTLYDGIVMWEDLDGNYWEEDCDRLQALYKAIGLTEEVFEKYTKEDRYMKYKMMTAKETIDELFTRKDRKIDFTFDQDTIDPSGWYCIKLTQIFDEGDYVLAMGYYGGGCTEAYDIYGLVDNSDNEECIKEFCEQKLQNFMNTWCDSVYSCEKICVEIEGDN